MPNVYHDGYDAFAKMVGDHTSEQIAYHLIHESKIWEGRSLDTGAARVRACTNRNREETFKFSEIIAISQFTKNYDALYFFCDMCGLSRPHVLTVEQQLENIKGSIDKAVTMLAAADSLMENFRKLPEKPRNPVPPARNFCHRPEEF